MTKKELLAENDRLRRQVVDLHAEVTILRARQITPAPLPNYFWQWPGSGIVIRDVPMLPGSPPFIVTSTATAESRPGTLFGDQPC